jgi:hypothetical protein
MCDITGSCKRLYVYIYIHILYIYYVRVSSATTRQAKARITRPECYIHKSNRINIDKGMCFKYSVNEKLYTAHLFGSEGGYSTIRSTAMPLDQSRWVVLHVCRIITAV